MCRKTNVKRVHWPYDNEIYLRHKTARSISIENTARIEISNINVRSVSTDSFSNRKITQHCNIQRKSTWGLKEMTVFSLTARQHLKLKHTKMTGLGMQEELFGFQDSQQSQCARHLLSLNQLLGWQHHWQGTRSGNKLILNIKNTVKISHGKTRETLLKGIAWEKNWRIAPTKQESAQKNYNLSLCSRCNHIFQFNFPFYANIIKFNTHFLFVL